MRRWETVILPLLTLSAILAVWHVTVIFTHTGVFPSPVSVYRGLVELIHKSVLFKYIGDSVFRVGVGYVSAVALGIPLGVTLGYYPKAADAVNPIIQILRPISPLAWIPLAVVWFGVGNLSAIFLIFLASLFPTIVATLNAVRNTPSIFLRAGRNFGLAPASLLTRVIFPAALPQIMVGLRISLGIAWLVVVAAEMIAVESGLGYLVIDSRNAGKRYDLVVAGMLLIGTIGWALDTGIQRFNKLRSVRWGNSV